MEDLHRLNPSLTVTDNQRAQALSFVEPRDKTRKPLAALVTTIGIRAVFRVPYLGLRVTHACQKLRERFHRKMDREDAAVDIDNSRRGRTGQYLFYVFFGDMLRIERKDLVP